MTITGDEYETAQGTSLNGSNGVLCPPTGPAPTLPTPCWVWSAPRLGQGTYTQVFSPGTPADVAAQIVRWTFVLRTDDDDTIAGDGTAHLDFAPGEQNVVGLNHRFVCTVHLTVGTGRLVGVAGTLTGDLVSTVVDIDPSTNISHKSVTASFTGPITTG